MRFYHHPLLFGLGLVASACASGPGPQALPPVSMAPPAPEIEEPLSTAPQEQPLEPVSESSTGERQAAAAEDADDAAPGEESVRGESSAATDESDDITVVIEPASGEEQPKSLYAAAQAERRRREALGESSIVINDKNLKEYSQRGQLTYVEEPAAEEGAAGSGVEGGNEAEGSASPEAGTIDLAKEEFWRDRVSDVRRAWREEIDRIVELEGEVAALRRDFYAEDDPFYRDSQIKPKWDRALEALEQSRHAAREHRERLDGVLEEGRKAGALPGWLREGIELEPTAEELESLDLGADGGEVGEDGTRFHQPSEPDVLDEDGESDGR